MSYYFFKDIVQTEFIKRPLTVCKKNCVGQIYDFLKDYIYMPRL